MGILIFLKTNNRNGEFTAKAQAYIDKVSLIYPTELRSGGGGGGDDEHYGSTARNSFSGSLSYSQIINQRLQLMFIADLISQKGLLSLPFTEFILMTILFIKKTCQIQE